MNTTTKIILGVATAAVAGAAIGMLIAPEKGAEIQQKIKEGARIWMKNVMQIMETGREIASEFNDATQRSLNEKNPGRSQDVTFLNQH